MGGPFEAPFQVWSLAAGAEIKPSPYSTGSPTLHGTLEVELLLFQHQGGSRQAAHPLHQPRPTRPQHLKDFLRFCSVFAQLLQFPSPKKQHTHTHAHTPKLAPNEPRSSANPLIKKWIEMVDRHFIEYWGTPIYCNNETFDRFQVSELWYCSNIYVFIQHGSNKLECLLGKSSISRYVVLLLFVLLDLTVGNWLRGPQHYSARWMAHIIYINIIFHLFCSVNLHLSVNFRTHVYNVHIYI
jgi:hypothetical protein